MHSTHCLSDFYLIKSSNTSNGLKLIFSDNIICYEFEYFDLQRFIIHPLQIRNLIKEHVARIFFGEAYYNFDKQVVQHEIKFRTETVYLRAEDVACKRILKEG